MHISNFVIPPMSRTLSHARTPIYALTIITPKANMVTLKNMPSRSCPQPQLIFQLSGLSGEQVTRTLLCFNSPTYNILHETLIAPKQDPRCLQGTNMVSRLLSKQTIQEPSPELHASHVIVPWSASLLLEFRRRAIESCNFANRRRRTSPVSTPKELLKASRRSFVWMRSRVR